MTTTHQVSRRTVGTWLREKRQRLRLSQAQVAREAGITQGSLSNYETGKREVSIETLLRLSAALDADIGELIGADESIIDRSSRLARALEVLQERSALLDHLVPAEVRSGQPLVGYGKYVPRTHEVTWSDDYFRILGLEPGEQTPSMKVFFERVHPDDRDEFREYLKTLAAGLSYVRGFQLRLVMPDSGEVRSVRTQSRAEYDTDGTPLVLYGTITYYPPEHGDDAAEHGDATRTG